MLLMKMPHRVIFLNRVAKPIVENCLEGYNGTIFAYGQTGSGKTFTIQGPSDLEVHDENKGLLYRSFEYIFTNLEHFKNTRKYIAYCSYLEIYNENILDLLDPSAPILQLRESMLDGVYVEGAEQKEVCHLQDIHTIIKQGTANRHVNTTEMNKDSSRSHAILTLRIECQSTEEGDHKMIKSAFHIIDLAGSERAKRTQTAGASLKEACNINKSLSVLGSVIQNLVDMNKGKNRFIHYRDSKLTQLLKNSLGGNAKTLMIANISPSSCSHLETLSTLRFAQRAKLIKNKAIINLDTKADVSELRLTIKRLQARITQLESEKASSMVDSRLYSVDAKRYLTPSSAVNPRATESVRLHRVPEADDMQIDIDPRMCSPGGVSELSELRQDKASSNSYLLNRLKCCENLLVSHDQHKLTMTKYYEAELSRCQDINRLLKESLESYKQEGNSGSSQDCNKEYANMKLRYDEVLAELNALKVIPQSNSEVRVEYPNNVQNLASTLQLFETLIALQEQTKKYIELYWKTQTYDSKSLKNIADLHIDCVSKSDYDDMRQKLEDLEKDNLALNESLVQQANNFREKELEAIKRKYQEKHEKLEISTGTEIADLRDTIASYELQLEQHKVEIDSLNDKVCNISSQYEKLKIKSQKEVKRLSDALFEERTSNDKIKKDASYQTYRANQLAEERESLTTRVDELDDLVQSLENKLDAHETHMIEADARASYFENENRTLQESIDYIEAQNKDLETKMCNGERVIADQRNELEKLSTILEDYKQKYYSLQDETSSKTSKHSQLVESLKLNEIDLRDQISKKTQECDDLVSNLQALEDIKVELEDKIEELSHTVDYQKINISSLTEECAKQRETINSLTSKCSELDERMKFYQSQLEKYKQDITVLTTKATELSQQLTEETVKNNQYIATLTTTQTQLDTKMQILQTTEKKLQKTESKLETKQHQLDEAVAKHKDDLGLTESKIATLTDRLQRTNEKVYDKDRAIDACQAQIEQFRSQIEDMTKIIQEKHEEIDRITNLYKETLSELDCKKYDIQEYHKQLGNLQEALETTIKNKKKVEADNDELRIDNSRLAGHNNTSQKLSYMNKLRSEYNALLTDKEHQEKLMSAKYAKLQQECETVRVKLQDVTEIIDKFGHQEVVNAKSKPLEILRTKSWSKYTQEATTTKPKLNTVETFKDAIDEIRLILTEQSEAPLKDIKNRKTWKEQGSTKKVTLDSDDYKSNSENYPTFTAVTSQTPKKSSTPSMLGKINITK